MVSRLRRLTGWSLLAVYAGIALLGHAGMHEFQGGHRHAHGVAASAGDDQHPHADSGCGHCHSHTTAASADGGSDQEQRPHHHGPAHDHDDCLVCQYFAAKALDFSPPALLDLAAAIEQTACSCSPLIEGADAYVLPIRGPPAIGC